MNLSSKLWTAFENKPWFKPGIPVLLAVSGGKDSMALLHFCYEKKLTIGVATINHNLRGQESKKEANLVKRWCQKRGIPHFLLTVPVDYWKTQKGNFQEQARILRYNWLKELMQNHGYHYLFTAHHATDQIETVIQFFLRGTGIHGMGGMMIEQSLHIRPLLICSAQEIESYITENKIPYLDDSSNAKDKYNRNKIRHKVLPAFMQVDSEFEGKALSTIVNLQNSAALLTAFIHQFKETHFHYFRDGFSINTNLLNDLKPLPTFLYHLFQELELNSSQIHDLVRTIEKPKEGASILCGKAKIVYSRGALYQLPLNIQESPIVISKLPTTCSFGMYDYEFILTSKQDAGFEPNQLVLNAHEVKLPLKLIPPAKGERFTPFGLSHKKLISDFLTDRKANPAVKQSALLLKDAGGRTLALLPLEIEQAFALNAVSENVICIKIKKAGT